MLFRSCGLARGDELASRLRSLTGVALSPTVVFEQPTPRAIAAHLLEQVTESCGAAGPVVPAAGCTADAASPVAVVCMFSRWPGGCNGDDTRTGLQQACGNAMGSVPAMRWVLADVIDVSLLSDTQMSCVQHGGWVAGAHCFDNAAFSVSPAEAAAMDPQIGRAHV